MKMLTSTVVDNHGNTEDFLRGWKLLGGQLGRLESQRYPGVLHLEFRNPNEGSSARLELDLDDFSDLLNDEDSTVFARLVSQAVLDELLRWPDGRSGQSRITRGGRVDQ